MADKMVDQTSGQATLRYSHGAATFHWLTAAMVLGQIWVGLQFADMPKGPERMQLFTVHKTLGVAILLVTLLRLGYRLMHRPPPYPADLPRLDRFVAVWSHRLFYGLLVALPLTGLIAASGKAKNGMVDLLWGLQVPALPLGEGLGEVHAALAWATIALLILHIAGGVWHQWIRRDHAAGRMPPLQPKDDAGIA